MRIALLDNRSHQDNAPPPHSTEDAALVRDLGALGGTEFLHIEGALHPPMHDVLRRTGALSVRSVPVQGGRFHPDQAPRMAVRALARQADLVVVVDGRGAPPNLPPTLSDPVVRRLPVEGPAAPAAPPRYAVWGQHYAARYGKPLYVLQSGRVQPEHEAYRARLSAGPIADSKTRRGPSTSDVPDPGQVSRNLSPDGHARPKRPSHARRPDLNGRGR